MAIYHLNVRGVSPSRGSSAVKSAAYQSAERLRDARTGELCDYSRKERVDATGIELPEGAPAWAADRQSLWDQATAAWAGGRELVARRVVVALPRELDADLAEAAVRDLARSMADSGHAADWAIHGLGGGNPHAHVLASALALGPEGFRRPEAPKAVKHYLCRDASGREREVPAPEWKAAKAEGWAKVFRYRVGDGEERLTQAEAAARGLGNDDRASKSPVARCRRPDGTSAREAERSELVALRARWADVANARLAEQAARDGTRAARIDHRSNADRGLDEAPTVHEGPAVTAMERRREAAGGPPEVSATDRRTENDQVRRQNGVIAELVRTLWELRERLGLLDRLRRATRRASTGRRGAAAARSHRGREARRRRRAEESRVRRERQRRRYGYVYGSDVPRRGRGR